VHMYVANQHIFLSQGYDGREVLVNLGGEAACHVAYGRDIDGIERVEGIEGIHTLGTVLVDYCGNRIVCQSIVPGILNGGAPAISFPSAEDAPQDDKEVWLEDSKKIGSAFNLSSHTVEADGELFCPPDAKGIKGTDGRRYWLDMYRSTPPDANWTSAEGYPHKMLVLRHELVAEFLERKLQNWIVENRDQVSNGVF
jgi:protein TIF31